MKILDNIFRDVGIDLGTTNSLIYVRNKGIAINEPTYAAINHKTNQILAVGDGAKRMLSRTPAHISVIKPLTGGVISDFDTTQELLRQFLRRIATGPFFGYRRGVLAIPDNLTEVERKSLEDAVLNAGCAKVYLVEAPVAAALGAHLPIHLPTASLVVDIGGGTTDIAVISMGGPVVSKTLKIAGDKFNSEIMRFASEEFRLAIGEPTAELAKIMIGSAVPMDERLEMPIRGRDVGTGLPKEVIMKGNHVRVALSKSLKAITEAVREVISMTPPELVGDMLEQGMTVCGGGALLRGIDRMLEKESSVRTVIGENPLMCVAYGLGRIVDDFEGHRKLLENPLKPLVINL